MWCPFNDPGENLTVKKIETIIGFSSDLKNEGGVLVACYGGVNRSSAVCALVMHYIDNIKDKESCEIVKKKNHTAGIRKELTVKIKNLLGLNIA